MLPVNKRKRWPVGIRFGRKLKKLSAGKGPSRREVDEDFRDQLQSELKSAQAVLKQMHEAGIDHKNADIQIKGAAIQSAQSEGAAGSFDSSVANQFNLKLAVKPMPRQRTNFLSGDYIVSAVEAEEREMIESGGRFSQWSHLPVGIWRVAARILKTMYENMEPCFRVNNVRDLNHHLGWRKKDETLRFAWQGGCAGFLGNLVRSVSGADGQIANPPKRSILIGRKRLPLCA